MTELQALRAIGRKVERHYGRPQDIEWAVDRHTRAILLLQSRPETVWSTQGSRAGGRAAADPSVACDERYSEADGEPDRRGRRGNHAAAGAVELRRAESGDRRREAEPASRRAPAAQTRAAPHARATCRAAAPVAAAPRAAAPRRGQRSGRSERCTTSPSPLLGTFYRAPKPGAPPFVEVGAPVEEDTIIGIIEVMKLMNTVRAGVQRRGRGDPGGRRRAGRVRRDAAARPQGRLIHAASAAS